MFYSVGSIITTVFLSSLMVFLLFLLCKRNQDLTLANAGVLILSTCIVATRLLLPTEFLFTNTLLVQIPLPNIFRFLRSSLNITDTFRPTVGNIVGVIWILVALLKIMIMLLQYISFKRSALESSVSCDNDAHNAIQEVFLHEHNKPVKVISSPLVSSPLICGLRRPLIVVPMIQLSVIEWKYIARHEAAHLKNNDLKIKFILDVLRLVYWWNPLVYWLCKRAKQSMEIRADAHVTETLSEVGRIDYADCILKIAKQQRMADPFYPSLFLGGGSSAFLFHRFNLILNRQDTRKRDMVKTKLLFLSLLIVFVLSFFIVVESYFVDAETARTTFSITPDNSYLVTSVQNGLYDLYVDGQFMITIAKEDELFENLSVVTMEEHVKRLGTH